MTETLSLKDLRDIAVEYLSPLQSGDKFDLRLEGAKYNEDDQNWEIIVSFLIEEESNTLLKFKAFVGESEEYYTRVYKKLIIDENKHVKSFEMYDYN